MYKFNRKKTLTGIIMGALILLTCSAFATEIQVEVKNVKPNEGTIRIALYAKDGFLKKPVNAHTADSAQEIVGFTFKNLVPGEYAVSAYQDSNGNNKLDTNFLGIPSEPLGMSRNAKGRMGPPAFDDAKIVITDKPEKILIQLK